ncbi:MAG: xylulokinase [Alkaliphilus sp.]|nr:xylulokinase [Alkaliphilus sp.]
MSKFLLAHDLGTSGDKATLFSTDGKLLDSCTYEYETKFFNGNWAEQNPMDWWKAFCSTNKRLLKGRDTSQVAGLAFSGQMMGCVCVDINGQVLRNAIIWADQRSVEEEKYIKDKIDETEFYKIVGHKISASYSIEKLMWIRNNEPDIFKQTFKILLPKDYIIYRLTGKFVTDYSDASGTNAFDLINLRWSDRIIDISGLDKNLFPEVHPSTHIAGEVSKVISEECGLAPGTKVIIGGGDGVCAAVGAASVEENVAYNYLGSSSWVAYTAKKPVFDKELRTFNWAHMIPGYYAPTGTMQAAANSYNFMKKILFEGLSVVENENSLGVYDLMNNQIISSKIGANGLLFLPYLLGERSPRWNPNARGAFIGLKMEHTKGDLIRATVEGILMNLDIVLQIFKKESNITDINVIGGLAQSDPILRILADVYGINVHKLSYLEEATSIGAAIAAGVGSGELKDFNEVHKFIRREENIAPNRENHQGYEKVKEVFNNSYYALLDIYQQLITL